MQLSYRLDGMRLSRAESLMPGLDTRTQKTMIAASEAMMATSGAMIEMKKLASDWRKLSAALIDGKDKTVTELQNVASILDKTGQAVSRSESQVKSLVSRRIILVMPRIA